MAHNMKMKRKFDEVDDSDNEEPSLGRQTLPVANLPDDFSGIPEDGMQYLFTVRRDARLLPHVTRVANPYELPEPPLRGEGHGLAVTALLPSEEWRKHHAKRFRHFRKNLIQQTRAIGPQQPQTRGKKSMPEKKERDLWWAFLSGKTDSEWDPPRRPKGKTFDKWSRLRTVPATDAPRRTPYTQESHSVNENDADEVSSIASSNDEACDTVMHRKTSPGGGTQIVSVDTLLSAPQSENVEEPTSSSSFPAAPSPRESPREPTPSLIRRIDERYALHLLMYFTHWINLYLQDPTKSQLVPTECHARWIFSLLGRVEDQISADDQNLLRHLVRACLALLKTILTTVKPENPAEDESEKEREGSTKLMCRRCCWMIIATVVEVWAQRDLWDDAEEMIKGLTLPGVPKV